MISSAVIKLCRAVREEGGRALLVGGWVRDFIRGFQTTDYDLEVYGVEAAKLRELLDRHGRVDAVGEAFTVYKVKLREGRRRIVVDVSLPRRESKTGRGHRGFVVEGDPEMSFDEAARRRDFTINSMMYDPLSEKYIDPYSGRQDLERKIIRVVDPQTFIEDSLRVLRAMQFAARFEFDIEQQTLSFCRSIDLSDLPAERVRAEVEKWLLQATRPSIGLRAARELGIVEQLWPEIRALIDCPQDEISHPEGDVFAHTAMTLDEARKIVDDLPYPKRLTIMLAALCHDFGKPLTTKIEKDSLTANNHAQAGMAPAESFLDRLKIFTLDNYDMRSQVIALVKHHLIPFNWYYSQAAGETITDGIIRRLALDVEPGMLYRVERANRLGRGGNPNPEAEEWFIARVRDLSVEERAPEPLLLGRHILELGLQPGPKVGQITREVYQMQLDGKICTLEEAISVAKRIIEESDNCLMQ
ncbi:MAG: HD domain-containing protein [Acidobacteria bacterium]|nr:HD domain-containing protein [Acidobacteriota bacterium]